MKNRALCIKSVKFGMVVHITILNIFRYGGVAPVPPGGRWRHLHFSSPSNHVWPIKPEFRVAILFEIMMLGSFMNQINFN